MISRESLIYARDMANSMANDPNFAEHRRGAMSVLAEAADVVLRQTRPAAWYEQQRAGAIMLMSCLQACMFPAVIMEVVRREFQAVMNLISDNENGGRATLVRSRRNGFNFSAKLGRGQLQIVGGSDVD